MSDRDPRSLIRIARADGGAAVAEPLDLGQRVRGLRKDLGLTLEQAARQAGLARSTLSKIENGQMSPTYDALKKLATGLAISVPQLFTPPAAGQATGRWVVTRAGEGARHATTTSDEPQLMLFAWTSDPDCVPVIIRF